MESGLPVRQPAWLGKQKRDLSGSDCLGDTIESRTTTQAASVTIFYSLMNEIQAATKSKATRRQLRALTNVTDFFLAGSSDFSEQHIKLFDEVFKTLVAVIELKTRIMLARHFATDPTAPATLVRAFACDSDIDVAGPVLRQSLALSETDLVRSASTQGQDHLFAIAQRQTVSEAITEILIQRGAAFVVHAVARNAGARISDNGFAELVRRSASDDRLALHVGGRHDIPRYHFLKLLDAVSVSVRRKIVAENPDFADVVPSAVT